MGSIADLYASVRADMSQFDSDLSKGLTKSADRSAKTFGDRFRAKLTASNIGAALGGIGAAALRMGAAYDDAMDTIRIATGATGDTLAGLEADFKAVAARVPDDLGTVATVIADLNTRTGQTGEGLQELAEQILDLSRLTRTDAATNVANLTRLFGDWSIATEDQAEALDKMFRASQSTGIGIDALATQVVQFGAPLRNIGFEFEEAIALLAKWEKEGVNTTLSLGGLKIALGEFAKQGVDAQDGLADLVDQILNAGTAAEAMAIGVSKFGSRAGPDMVAAIREGRFATEDLVDTIRNGDETIAAATRDTEGLGEAWRQFKNIVATTVGPITEDLGGIAAELGNLIFLLPAVGGLLGKGIGAAVGRALPAIRSAGRAAGLAYGTAFIAAAAIIAVELQELARVWGGVFDQVDANRQAAEAILDRAAYADARAEVEKLTLEVRDLQAAHAEYVKNFVATTPFGPFDPFGDLLGGQTLERQVREAEAKLEQAQETLRRHNAAATLPFELSAPVDEAEDAGAETAAAFSDGFKRQGVSIGDAVQTVAGSIRDFITIETDAALAQMQRLVEAIATVAAGGLKSLRSQEKDADEAWKNIIGAGDRNRQRLRQVREDIDKWQRRLRRANKLNDSEGTAFAQAQLDRLTTEQQERRAVVDWTKDQHKALDALPEKTTTTVNVVGEASLDRVITKIRGLTSGEAVVRIDGQVFGGIGGRASGGPVSANTPYVVGERGPEVIIPRTSGTVIANDRLGGDTYNITPQIHGLPMRAQTPLEVVQQLRRAVRMGVVAPRQSQKGFST